MSNTNEYPKIIEALHFIPPTLPREQWVQIGMALRSSGCTFEDFDFWSSPAENYKETDCRSTWKSFNHGEGIGVATLFKVAKDHGWIDAGGKTANVAQIVRAKPMAKPKAGMDVNEVWERCIPATYSDPYIQKKNAAGVPLELLRVVPVGDSLTIMNERMAGALVVPVIRPDGTFSTLQFITPPEVSKRLKSMGKSDKLNLPTHSIEGCHTVGSIEPGGVIYIAEGIGQAWACWQATGQAAVSCFGFGNMGKVAKELRQLYPSTKLVLVPDVGKEGETIKIAQELEAAVASMPDSWARNSDVSDLMILEGAEVLELLLEGATNPLPSYPLSVVFADELPEAYTPSDELVQGVLAAGEGTVLYGDSNSGKTFFVIDMAAAVARGEEWMGRKTEKGLVVYLAAESPASVRRRLQAYQKYYNCKVPNFAIVQSPIDLFDGDTDTDKVIQLVKLLERKQGSSVRLIIGDTLARLSAGANENAGQDMGQVVRRIDKIRTECNAHFLLIHHSGKNAAAGSRGWSGVRAAVDTEIEITNSPTARCCEITKQRDLSTKDVRIGFRLEQVILGLTKWGDSATSCVVVATDAPVKKQKKKTSECDGAVLEFLVAHKIGIKKTGVVRHFEGRYVKGPIYRSMLALVEAGAIHEAAGMVCAAQVSK